MGGGGRGVIDVKIAYRRKKMYYWSGIERDKTMADNLRYISNDDTQNYSFYRLQSVVETKEHSTY